MEVWSYWGISIIPRSFEPAFVSLRAGEQVKAPLILELVIATGKVIVLLTFTNFTCWQFVCGVYEAKCFT